MMKRLKTLMAAIKPGNNFPGRHDDGELTPAGSGSIGEPHLRHTASLRSSQPGERGRHERARRRTRNPGANMGQSHAETPCSHRHRLR
ncbi:hypothetical protein SAMN05192548_1011181 [Paraburkholderia terricola]|jgi:hypothetical protein|uniref:Uncharacterized protein n=1 Tax=Paraburkholderia terricola TaxID=169427 RepID=A0A1M6P1K3_9BURK|nr:hypothetical protein SAMN05192547_1011181 [Paraburkholderia sediminicola]SHK01806.1 hypothetical protein SAMN05192548_1011181 [Paraburkholderia terricola]